MSATITLTQALQTPGLPHAVRCQLRCQRCGVETECIVRGFALSADGRVLGDLGCGGCGSADQALSAQDETVFVQAVERMLAGRKELPKGPDAFLRGGEFVIFGQTFEDPIDVRDTIDRLLADKPDDAATQVTAGLALYVIRDIASALKHLRRAHELAPESPEPLVYVADPTAVEIGVQEALPFARAALERKEGPMLIAQNRRLLMETAAKLLAAADPARAGQGGRVGRNDPCPCGSGKKYKKCCAA